MVPRTENAFLNALSEPDFRLLEPQLKSISLVQNDSLFAAGERIPRAYFPCGGVISLVVPLEIGETVEAGMIGRDGVVGSSAALGGSHALNEAIVQIPGPAMTLDICSFGAAARRSTTLRQLVYRYDQYILAQAQQSAACLAKHAVEARMCCWLLRSRDLAGTDELPLTHEFIAQMLGVRRVSVTLTAQHLHDAGLIRYRRGHITIIDLEAIQGTSCECYQTINRHQRIALGGRRRIN